MKRKCIIAAAIIFSLTIPEYTWANEITKSQLGKHGLKINTLDKKYELSIKGTLQFDSRQFIRKKNNENNEIIARRLRPVIEARKENISLRFMPDLSGEKARIFDLHLDYKASNGFNLRIGKFKPPIGLERLQSTADTFFIERGHPTNLVSSRDIGVMVYGNLFGEIAQYQLGIFNGNADLATTDSDDDSEKDVNARIFFKPFLNSQSFEDFGFGIAGSYGRHFGKVGDSILSAYKTPGQQNFFRYNSGSFADGTSWRLYPQGYWYYKNLGFIAEYAFSNQEVSNLNKYDNLTQSAWQIAGSYVLTGENVNFQGGVVPEKDFDFYNNGLGAWEIAGRVGKTEIDDKTFINFSNQSISAKTASSYGGGINWYLNQNIKMMINYDVTSFKFGASGGENRENEHALFTRLQFRL